MHQTTVPNSGPKLKLVEAAEKLFAEKGFEVVSVRDITQAAGGNVAAVNYHFGSRDGLIAIVINRYLSPISETRSSRLDALEKQSAGSAIPLEKLLEAVVLPLVERIEVSNLPESLHCQLVGRIFGMYGALPRGLDGQISDLNNRLVRLLARSLPMLGHEELVWRLHFMMGGLVHTLVQRESLERVADGAAGAPDLATTMARFLSWAAAGMREGDSPAAAVAEPGLKATAAPALPAPAEVAAPAPTELAPPAVAEPLPPAPAESQSPTPPSPAEAAIEEAAESPLETPAADEKKPESKGRRRAKKPDGESPQVFFDF